MDTQSITHIHSVSNYYPEKKRRRKERKKHFQQINSEMMLLTANGNEDTEDIYIQMVSPT